jgi:hypothetical protein
MVLVPEVVRDSRYLEAANRVLKSHDGLRFTMKTYVIWRRRS